MALDHVRNNLKRERSPVELYRVFDVSLNVVIHFKITLSLSSCSEGVVFVQREILLDASVTCLFSRMMCRSSCWKRGEM